MPALVKVASRTGDVLFEGEFSEAALQEIAIRDKVDDVVKEAGTRLSSIAATVRQCTADLLDTFDDLAKDKRDGGSFSSAEIELGISVTGEGNVVVARGSAKANLKVTLCWDFS
jgi:hypothetical protein